MKDEVTFSKEDRNKLLELYQKYKDQIKDQLVTIGDFYKDYLKELEVRQSKSYVSSHKTSYEYLKNHFGEDTLLREITRKDADQLIIEISKTAPRGVNVYLRNFRAAFNKALSWNYIEDNPFQSVKKIKFQKVEEPTINREELYEIWVKIKKQVIRDIVTVAFFTGMRLGEVVNLKWKDVDLEKGLITVGSEHYTTKTKEYRKIPFGAEVEFSITNHLHCRDKSEYVFTKDGRFPYTTNHVSRKFKDGVKEWNKINKLHFHSLRHSFGTNFYKATNDLYKVQKLLGHTQISTTQRYSHFDYEEARESIGRL